MTLPDLSSECIFTTQRSSGPGGQHVNKTETKVELRFNISTSQLLNNNQRYTLMGKLSGKLVDENTTLIITSQVTRSQLKNKNITIRKLHELFESLLEPEIERIPTRPTRASKEKRLWSKKKYSKLKAQRGNLRNRLPEE
ncbi:MAG: alternative ribosome rescue aminoacyl-tRNA hydrolase ArfB [Saprospiraceae bacterium]